MEENPTRNTKWREKNGFRYHCLLQGGKPHKKHKTKSLPVRKSA
jgi:hypothetical protein